MKLRRATLRDISTLVEHRRKMFEALGPYSERQHQIGDREYRKWVRPRLRSGRFLAWIVEARGRPVAGGAVWCMDQQPRPGLPARCEPYLLSMYTDPAYRGRGLASRIVRAAMRWARRQGYKRMNLHAAPLGRGVYRKLGFERTWEMRAMLRPRK